MVPAPWFKFSSDGSQVISRYCDAKKHWNNIDKIIPIKSILTHQLSLEQATLLNAIHLKITEGKKLILDKHSAEVFRSLDPEIQKALNSDVVNLDVIKTSFAATAPCTIV